jgi:hypothetical protein
MAFLAAIDASPTIGTSEYSMVGETTTSVPLSNTTETYITVVLDLNALAAADVFEMKVYEKADTGTQRVRQVYTFAGVQPGPGDGIDLGHFKQGYDITLKKVSGTDRSIPFTLLRVG